MEKIKKGYKLKIIAVAVVLAFTFNATVCGEGYINKPALRVPLLAEDSKRPEEIKELERIYSRLRYLSEEDLRVVEGWAGYNFEWKQFNEWERLNQIEQMKNLYPELSYDQFMQVIRRIRRERKQREEDRRLEKERQEKAYLLEQQRNINLGNRMLKEINKASEIELILQIYDLIQRQAPLSDKTNRAVSEYNRLREKYNRLPELILRLYSVDSDLNNCVDAVGRERFIERIGAIKAREQVQRLQASENIFSNLINQLHWIDSIYGKEVFNFLNMLKHYYESDCTETLPFSGNFLKYIRVKGDNMDLLHLFDVSNYENKNQLKDERINKINNRIALIKKEMDQYEKDVTKLVLTGDEEDFIEEVDNYCSENHLGFNQIRSMPKESLKRRFRDLNGNEVDILSLIKKYYRETGFLIVPNSNTIRLTFSDYQPDSSIISAPELAKIYYELGDYLSSIPKEIFASLGFLPPILIEGSDESGKLGAARFDYITVEQSSYSAEYNISIGPPQSIHYWHNFGYKNDSSVYKIFNHEFFGHIMVFEALRKGIIGQLMSEEQFKAMLRKISEAGQSLIAGVTLNYRLVLSDTRGRSVSIDYNQAIDMERNTEMIKEAVLLGVPSLATGFNLYWMSLREIIAREAEIGIFLGARYLILKNAAGETLAYHIEHIDNQGKLKFTEVGLDVVRDVEQELAQNKKETLDIIKQRAIDRMESDYRNLRFDLSRLSDLYDIFAVDPSAAETGFRELRSQAKTVKGSEEYYYLADFDSAQDLIRAINNSREGKTGIDRVIQNAKIEFIERLIGFMEPLIAKFESEGVDRYALLNYFLQDRSMAISNLISDLIYKFHGEDLFRSCLSRAELSDKDEFWRLVDFSGGTEVLRQIILNWRPDATYIEEIARNPARVCP
ncbi:MAG: hypothetical protein Q8O12_05695 [Candidatus Omnitrophota bacterium]|nr:hypothetical protein [Candidatus Omnitrophota bacterium]